MPVSRRVRSITTLLTAYSVPGAAISSVIRDLAVAAYALRQRDQLMDILVVHPPNDPLAQASRDAADRLHLPLTTLACSETETGAAFLQGLRYVAEGTSDVVVTLDPNGRHDATQIPHLIDQLLSEDADVVIGSRWAPGSGTPGLTLQRWLLGRMANLVFRVLTETRGIADATTTFRVVRTEVIRDFSFRGVPLTNHTLQTEFVAMAAARGYRVREGAIIYRPAKGVGGELRLRDVGPFARHLFGLRPRVQRVRRQRLSAPGQRFRDQHFGASHDLEQLATALHFFNWVLDEFDPHLRGRVLEVGAGMGTITRELIARYRDISVVSLEPAHNLYADLDALAAIEPRVRAHEQTLAEYCRDTSARFDAALYLNVLEHIEDDAQELRRAAAVLRSGGALLVFGPGLPWMYSDLDYQAGHYRRYRPAPLARLAAEAGFKVLTCHYFDVLGVLPYFLVYRLMGHDQISGSTLWWYDRVLVPLSRALQRALGDPPIGKNVILIARKP